MSNLSKAQITANQGDFYWAAFIDPRNGNQKWRPVFIVGKNCDSNDHDDVIVSICTTQPERSNYDILVHLKKPTLVRTNKLYTIGRDQLDLKIHHQVDELTISTLLEMVSRAVRHPR